MFHMAIIDTDRHENLGLVTDLRPWVNWFVKYNSSETVIGLSWRVFRNYEC